jgi:DNA replication protein DnaC
MSYEQTIEKMKSMHLNGMARSFQATSEMGFTKITPDELVAMLIDAEHDERSNKKLARLLKKAKLRYRASMEHIDFQFKRNLDKNMLMRFATNTWITNKQSNN